MRVLVTGGAGFIGSHVADGALAAGHEVAVLDDFSTGRRENVPMAARLYEVDVRDRAAVQRAFLDFRPEVVNHQAAQSSVSVSIRDPKFDVEVNVVGGLNLLDSCVDARVKHFVFASTGGAIYGEVSEGSSAAERTAPAPLSPYAISKLAFEQLLSVYQAQHGLSSTILRYANVYGPRQDPHGEAGVVAVFFDALLSQSTLRVFAKRNVGDAGCIRDYVYVSDVVKMNLLALEGQTEHPVANVGTGVGTSTLELAKLMAQIAGRQPTIEFGPQRAGDLERSVLDPSRCLEKLGEMTDLATGLRSTYDWFLTTRRPH